MRNRTVRTAQPVRPRLTRIRNASGVAQLVVTDTHFLGARLGKNTRVSDITGSSIKRKKKTHTSPVSRMVNDHIDETGARDPSRIRHAVTAKRRTLEALACQ